MIEKARENMHAKHPKTRFVNAHVAMLYYDMDKVAAFLDKYPNADVELSATVQDLGRAPLMIRQFFLKYQDRILFGSDGNPGRGVEEFWVPHWRFLETYDEHFDHPAQIRSPTGAPLHGRWRIYGIGLPDDVLRKVYYANALALPAVGSRVDRETAGSTAITERLVSSPTPVYLYVAATLALGGITLAQAPSPTGLPVTYERLLNAAGEPGNWLTYSGDYRSHHYSSLNQITADNVHRLRAKWIYQMHRTKVETTPIVVDGVMYVTRPPSDVIALDAETGRALWTYEHQALRPRVHVLRRGQSRAGDPRQHALPDDPGCAAHRARRAIRPRAVEEAARRSRAELHRDRRAAGDQGQGHRRHRWR